MIVAIADDGRIIGASVGGDSDAMVVGSDGAIDNLTEPQEELRLGSSRTSPVTFDRHDLDGTLVVAIDGSSPTPGPR